MLLAHNFFTHLSSTCFSNQSFFVLFCANENAIMAANLNNAQVSLFLWAQHTKWRLLLAIIIFYDIPCRQDVTGCNALAFS